LVSAGTAVSTGLAVGIGLVVVFASLWIPRQTDFPAILDTPRLSQKQAIEILANTLDRNSPDFKIDQLHIYDIYGSQNIRWVNATYAMQLDRQVIHLIFYHQNGTQIHINPTDNTVSDACPPDECRNNPKFVGKLLYVIEADYNGFEVYIIDAIRGNMIQPTSFNRVIVNPSNNTSFA
jgi:hypothetical protein